MTEQTQSMDLEDRKQEAFRVAQSLFHQTPDWVTFFREILGTGGAVRRLFPEKNSMAFFEKTAEYNEIQVMLARLRQSSNSRADNQEPTKVITVRMPKSLHEALLAEAYAHQTSMNKLCITKLLQVIDAEMASEQSPPSEAPVYGSTDQYGSTKE